MPETAIECPATLDEFQQRVVSFAEASLDDLLRRYEAGERGFSYELRLDRSQVRVLDGSFVPLSWFQSLFYDKFLVQFLRLEEFEAYADFESQLNEHDSGVEIFDNNTMLYRLSIK